MSNEVKNPDRLRVEWIAAQYLEAVEKDQFELQERILKLAETDAEVKAALDQVEKDLLAETKASTLSSISIYRDLVWAGDGRIVDGAIVDCSAELGRNADDSELTYQLIEDALGEGKPLGSIRRPDGEYSWQAR